MTPQAARAKGARWEQDCAEYLQTHGWPYAERRHLSGAFDRGDITGVPAVMIECKHERTYKPAEWLREADVQAVNDSARVAAVWARLNGKPGAGNGVIFQRPDQFLRLLIEAGYGTPLSAPLSSG
ncbi:MAG: hypothetical protein ABW022_08675 [Actinoplanes sp.]